MRLTRSIVAGLGVLWLAGLSAPALELGDDAPPLSVKKWVKGGPVDLKEGRGKNIYLIEFWATWCGPCVRGIPHMTELQKKYKDKGLVVVSISSADRNLETVTKFVELMGSKMDYTVGYEDKGAAPTDKAYMDGFKKKGIPQCFLVDKKGKIVWEGNPLLDPDEVIATVVAGEYDIKKLGEIGERAAKRKMEQIEAQEAAMMKYFQAMAESVDVKANRELGEKTMKLIEGDADRLNEFAWRILADEGLKGRDLELALRAGKAANDLTKGEDFTTLDTYARALFDNGKVKEAIETQKKAVELVSASKDVRKEFEETLKKYQDAEKKP